MAITLACANSFHKDRRDYLRHQLKQLLCLCEDKKILASKFPVLASAVGFAREEIIWYFSHNEKRKRKKEEKPGVQDLAVSELIWLLKVLVTKMKKNKSSKMIEKYF